MSPVTLRTAKLMFALVQAINPCDLLPDLFEAADGVVEVLQ